VFRLCQEFLGIFGSWVFLSNQEAEPPGFIRTLWSWQTNNYTATQWRALDYVVYRSSC